MIDIAKQADVPYLADMLKEMHLESDMAKYPLNTERLTAHLRDSIDHGCVFLTKKAGVIEGLIAVRLVEHAFVDATYASEALFFIKKSCRHGIKAIRLINAAKAWSEEMNAAYFVISLTSGINRNNTEQLLSRLGGEQFGSQWRM